MGLDLNNTDDKVGIRMKSGFYLLVLLCAVDGCEICSHDDV